MNNKKSFILEEDLKKGVDASATINLTREASLQNKSKWQLFLEGYKNYYHTDFSWPKYIKDCKLYYGEFNIQDFIKTYGPECEEDFKQFRQKILVDKKINKDSNLTLNYQTIQVDEKSIELMINGDSLRTRLLIHFLNPQNKVEKKNLKKSWKNAKRSGLTRTEWMKSYVGLPFKIGKNDPLDEKYTRDEVIDLIKNFKQKIESSKTTQSSQKTTDLQTPKSLEYNVIANNQKTPEINSTNNLKNDEVENKNNKNTAQLSKFKTSNLNENYFEHDDFKGLKDLEDSKNNLKKPNFNNDNLQFEKHVDDQIFSIKQDRELVSQELKKANQLKIAEERNYEQLREERQRLSKDLENEDFFDTNEE